MYLKRATPQNIVIGGLAGALPPLLGWTAVTNEISPNSLLLVLIIFAWTPPHFWALAIHREQDYKKAQLPMLPVTHGIAFTKLCIILYTLLMIVTTVLPFVFGMSQGLYLIGALLLGSGFLYYTIKLYRTAESSEQEKYYALKTFWFSIFYLMITSVVLGSLLEMRLFSRKLIILISSVILIGIIGVFWGMSRHTNQPLQPVLTAYTLLPTPHALPNFSLTDYNHKLFSHKQLYNQWSFVFFGYTHCPSLCPATLGKLNELATILGPSAQFIFISINPEQDTPLRLKNFSHKNLLKMPNFWA